MTGEFEPEGLGDLRGISVHLRQEVRRLGPKGPRLRIRVGRGGLDETARLFSGETDIAVVTPAAAVRLLHQFGDLQGLVALGVVARRGGLIAAADAGLAHDTVSELVAATSRITVATPADDGVSLVGFAVRRALRIAGVDAQVTYVHDEQPATCCERFASGEADVVIHDLLSTPDWTAASEARPVKYLAWDARVLHGFASQGWPTRVVPAGRLPLLDADLPTLDCSDFAVLCREDLDDDVARVTARFLARTYRSAGTAATAPSPLPLHPAAARGHADLVADATLGSR
ncbi:hypothetical protein ACFY6U_51070 [Streptomyces sp. NPDC013157]|uniref:hypothetical protein n=1 Tax=Streptomyces sp. NPDC013157 TaxID=3364861 RepID=UPI0036B7B5AF